MTVENQRWVHPWKEVHRADRKGRKLSLNISQDLGMIPQPLPVKSRNETTNLLFRVKSSIRQAAQRMIQTQAISSESDLVAMRRGRSLWKLGRRRQLTLLLPGLDSMARLHYEQTLNCLLRECGCPWGAAFTLVTLGSSASSPQTKLQVIFQASLDSTIHFIATYPASISRAVFIFLTLARPTTADRTAALQKVSAQVEMSRTARQMVVSDQ